MANTTGTQLRKAADLLAEALELVDGLPSHTDPTDPINPPCTVLGPPHVRWETLSPAATSARFVVYVVENDSAGVIERMWDLLEPVVEAIETHTGGVVDRDGGALPSTFIAGSAQLPCYEIVVEVPLNG